jgi:4'-phosphopantetheinyl transferase
MNKLFAIELTNPLREDERAALMTICSAERLERVKKFVHQENADLSLLSEAARKIILAQQFKLDPFHMDMATNPHGRPYLLKHPHIHFNISHSYPWVVMGCGFSPLGVDIEKIGQVDLNQAQIYFSAEEQQELLAKKGAAQISFYYDLWTLKESYIKARGVQLDENLGHFSILGRHDRQQYYFKVYGQIEGYKVAVCTSSYPLPGPIVMLKISDLLNDMRKWNAACHRPSPLQAYWGHRQFGEETGLLRY